MSMQQTSNTGTSPGLDAQMLHSGGGGGFGGARSRSLTFSAALQHNALILPKAAIPVTAYALTALAKNPGAFTVVGLGLAAGALHPGLSVAAVTAPLVAGRSGAALFGSSLAAARGVITPLSGNILKPAKTVSALAGIAGKLLKACFV